VTDRGPVALVFANGTRRAQRKISRTRFVKSPVSLSPFVKGGMKWDFWISWRPFDGAYPEYSRKAQDVLGAIRLLKLFC